MSLTLHEALHHHIASHFPKPSLAGWPDSAEYAVEVRYSTWPCGFQDWHVVYFETRHDLNVWLESTRSWAKLEDNFVEFQAYEWDWGIKPIDRYSL